MLDWVIYNQNKREFPNIAVEQLPYFSCLHITLAGDLTLLEFLCIFSFKLWFSGRETYSARLIPLRSSENYLWRQGSSRVFTWLLYSLIVTWQSKLLCQAITLK